MNMDIDVEDVRLNQEERRRWNSVPFENIRFFYCGREVKIPDQLKEDWKFMGLSNVDFINCHSFPCVEDGETWESVNDVDN